MENKEKKAPGMKPFSDRGEIKQRVVLGVKGKYLSKFSSETVMKSEIYNFLEKHKGDLRKDCNK